VKKLSKKEIKAALDKLKEQPTQSNQQFEQQSAKLSPKHDSQRIRKQGSK